MSALRIITLVIGLSVSAEANPLAFMARTRAYLSSEHLSVTISGKEAQIRSTFTFRFEPDRLDYIKEMGGVEIELPIWIPDNDAGNGGIAEFWKTFGTFFLNGLGEKNRPQFDDTVSLSATLGSQGLAAQRLMSYSSHLDPRVLTTYSLANEEARVSDIQIRRRGVRHCYADLPGGSVARRRAANGIVSATVDYH